MNEFDTWREKYDKMSYEEQVAYHNDLEKRFPEQAHYTYGNVQKVFGLFESPRVLEFGPWKGDMACRIMKEFPIKSWTGIEICEDAIKNTHCDKLLYVQPNSFDWWNKDIPIECDILVATHFIEHLSNDHFEELIINYVSKTKAKYIYFEAPISQKGQRWEGYWGTHKLNYGWEHVINSMETINYSVHSLLHQGIIFKYEDR